MILHVACMPFPSHQGTQAAVDAMLRAAVNEGQSAELLTYAHGSHEPVAPYPIHRLPDFPKVRSLRSGPSWGKAALDLGCALAVRRLAKRRRPRAIVAHHVEAALAAIAARPGSPVYYLAHTSLSHELPTYFPTPFAPALASAALHLERFIHRSVDGTAALAPSLGALLPGNTAYVPVPWPLTKATLRQSEARALLGLPADAPTALYAGNLDAYQGWERLLPALAHLRQRRADARLLIATASDPGVARREIVKHRLTTAVDVRPLDGELARAAVHAAADLAWVPRRAEGGLPIKLLDAFARGLAVVATKRATAGLPVGSACEVVEDDDSAALAEGAMRMLDEPSRAEAFAGAARAYLASEHADAAFASAMASWTGSEVKRRSGATTRVPRPRAVPGPQAR